MFNVKDHTTEMLVEKQSKFIAHLMPYSMYAEVLETLKAEHPKARHFVTAFRYINDYDQIVEGSSDDGEPKGTSGKPTLAVLQGQELINVAVVVVRYFGGTKLGTGGLVRAYSDATNLVVTSAHLSPYIKKEYLKFSCSYSHLGRVEYALTQHGVDVEEKIFLAEGVSLQLSATASALERLYQELERLVFDVEK